MKETKTNTPPAPVAGSGWIDCQRHGWSARGVACPYCGAGDSPKHCQKHGWSHSTDGCPTCRLAPNPERSGGGQ